MEAELHAILLGLQLAGKAEQPWKQINLFSDLQPALFALEARGRRMPGQWQTSLLKVAKW